MKNIGVIGIGAIGSLITKYLIQNQAHNYFFFNRSPKEIIKIEFQGKEDVIHISNSYPKQQKLDWLIVCLKEYHFKNAIPILSELIESDTKVAIFQNGINIADRYKQFSDSNNLLETIIDCPVERIGPDAYRQIRNPKIVLPESEIANQFMTLFTDPSIEFLVSNNFKALQWIKLIESSSVGSIQAINKLPCSVFQDPEKLREFIELVDEGILVARSEGIILDKDLDQQLLCKLKAYPETKSSSMLSDKLSGNELELDAKIGVIVKIAMRNGVNVPTSSRVYNTQIRN